MPRTTGVALTGIYKFYKSGALADPSVAPTVIEASYPDGSILSGLPLSMTKVRVGVYTATVFTSGQVTQTGDYSSTAYTTDTTLDNPYAGYEWDDVGINVLSANNDKTGYALTSGEHTNIATDTQTGLTTQGYTATRAGYLDTLNGLVATIWANTSRTLTAFGFNVTVGTNNDKTGYALSGAGVQAIWDALTSALSTANSIGKLLTDNINATIASRSTLTAANVWDYLTASISTVGSIGKLIKDFIGSSSYTAPDNASITAIKTQTDKFTFTGNNVNAQVAGGIGSVDVTSFSGAAATQMNDIQAHADLIGAPSAPTVATPNTSTGVWTIYKARDFNTLDGLALTFTTAIPVYNTDTFAVNAGPVGNPFMVLTGTYVDANHVSVNVTRAQGLNLPIGNFDIEVVCTRSGRELELVHGKLIVDSVVVV